MDGTKIELKIIKKKKKIEEQNLNLCLIFYVNWISLWWVEGNEYKENKIKNKTSVMVISQCEKLNR